MHSHVILSAQPGGSKAFATGGKFGAGVFLVASKSDVLARSSFSPSRLMHTRCRCCQPRFQLHFKAVKPPILFLGPLKICGITQPLMMQSNALHDDPYQETFRIHIQKAWAMKSRVFSSDVTFLRLGVIGWFPLYKFQLPGKSRLPLQNTQLVPRVQISNSVKPAGQMQITKPKQSEISTISAKARPDRAS